MQVVAVNAGAPAQVPVVANAWQAPPTGVNPAVPAANYQQAAPLSSGYSAPPMVKQAAPVDGSVQPGIPFQQANLNYGYQQ
jgi:hypothetical protein